LDDLVARAALRATRIQSPDAPQVDPADVSLDLELRGDRLRLDGLVRQRLIEPLRVSGNVPFDVAAIRRKGQIDPQTPIDLRVAMPRSSLAFLSTLIPAIRQSRGTATVDVNIGGSIGQPNLSGGISADLQTLRFTDPSLPPVANATLRVGFTRDRVTIDRFNAGIGGGSLNAAGSISLTPLNNPVFDLRVGSRNALVVQNDDLSVRASGDLQVNGSLNAASVTGNIFVTRSGFFRNIDILPIGLPGRPAPQPPAEMVVISFPDPPLRDWKFDVAIRTADPFRVQGNLANGQITMDLRFGGTGLEPWLDGTVRIDKLTATLPFSRLHIRSGSIYFSRDDPFVPRLDLRGTSTIRDYHVRVYITGPVTNPQAFFSSEPPLPQAEIVSLIATGSTTRELASNPNALAGRAAFLLFQKIYRSVFMRNKPPPADESFLSRVQFEFGAIDPKSGRQSASLSVPLSDRFVLVGGLGVGGNFRGQIKYLLRFK
ncbi:MAG: translocation/assembly module TamB domain-containing protein, partial [Terrimicrobiaceae bacterium]